MPASHLIDMRPSRAHGTHLFAANEPRLPHTLSRESSGTGLDDYARMTCSCGWAGPKRFGHDDFQASKLNSDASHPH